MKESFRENLGLRKNNIERLNVVNRIIEDYAEQDFKLTLRQLYYQLVSRAIIPNKVEEYAKLGALLVKGRMAGWVDWDAIEDRLRVPYIPYYADGPGAAIRDITGGYRRDRQDGQSVYIEVWVEKDALSGVLRRITRKYHVRLMVNRGYSSASAMYRAAKRFLHYEQLDREGVLLYLGDHDASGLDMIRDIRTRLNEFGTFPTVKHIALTTQQVQTFNPPPNPAKITDPRAKWYIEEHGDVSWEVDALPPEILLQLLESEIKLRIDLTLYEEQLEQEQQDIDRLEEIADTFDD